MERWVAQLVEQAPKVQRLLAAASLNPGSGPLLHVTPLPLSLPPSCQATFKLRPQVNLKKAFEKKEIAKMTQKSL